MTQHRTLISGFSWCYNNPVLSSNKLTLNCMRMAKCAHFTVVLTFQRLHYYYSALFLSFHYKFYICHLIAVLSFCNTSLIGRLLLFFGANTMISPPMRKRSLDIRIPWGFRNVTRARMERAGQDHSSVSWQVMMVSEAQLPESQIGKQRKEEAS